MNVTFQEGELPLDFLGGPKLQESEGVLTQTHGEGGAERQAEAGVMRPRVREHLQPPESGNKESVLSRSFSAGSTALPTPELGLWASKTVRE